MRLGVSGRGRPRDTVGGWVAGRFGPMFAVWWLPRRELQVLLGRGCSWAYWRLWAVGCTCSQCVSLMLAHAVPSLHPTFCLLCLLSLPPHLPCLRPHTLQFCTLSSGGDHPFWSTKEAPIFGTEGAFTASG
jgi:hypothetical protein